MPDLYKRDLKKAARRHLEAADHLPPTRKDVAGYLYGLAAEMAVKEMMIQCGYRPNKEDKSGPFWCHFPDLKSQLLDMPVGRYGTPLMSLVRSFKLEDWNTTMRYSAGSSVTQKIMEKWQTAAKSAVSLMDNGGFK